MIMVFYGLAEGRKTKTPQAFGDLRRFVWLKILSQPQVRADRAKPIKVILAAGCVVCLLAVHEVKVTERRPPSSAAVVWPRVGLIKPARQGKVSAKGASLWND
jgi:hypothetical protein